MKSVLIEDIIDFKDSHSQVKFRLEDGTTMQGYAIAKPLNYDKEYLDKKTIDAWIEEIRAGRAIAVHFTEDEIAAGEIPTLYKRAMKKDIQA